MSLPATTESALVLRIAPSGESFHKIDLLTENKGYLLCLQRISKKNPSQQKPDLFDSADLILEPSRQGTAYFIKEYCLTQHRRVIGQSYRKLKYASEFCSLIVNNAKHMADSTLLYGITERTLNAFVKKESPEIVSLKALYLFLKDEGYPVRESWWPNLPKHLQELARELINEPLSETASLERLELCGKIHENLRNWLSHETDFVLP